MNTINHKKSFGPFIIFFFFLLLIHSCDFLNTQSSSFELKNGNYKIKCEGATLIGLTGVKNRRIIDSNLSYCTILKTDFSDSSFFNIEIRDSILTSVTFVDATFNNVNFTNSKLNKVDFTGVTFNNVTFNNVQYDESTRFPSGFIPQEYGLTKAP
ncbi:MAG: pentapeptide repeat-containing protein [Halobacteriovoraceae bacterium]|nr:pentapeptide repeat-containing protein [Halobacteriovoraceae bacterium]